MLSLRDVARISPVNILYVGTEAEFMHEIRGVMSEIPDADAVEFTCFADAKELVRRLFAVPEDSSKAVVYGLFRHLQSASSPTILRTWIAIQNSGVELTFAEDPQIVKAMPVINLLTIERI